MMSSTLLSAQLSKLEIRISDSVKINKTGLVIKDKSYLPEFKIDRRTKKPEASITVRFEWKSRKERKRLKRSTVTKISKIKFNLL